MLEPSSPYYHDVTAVRFSTRGSHSICRGSGNGVDESAVPMKGTCRLFAGLKYDSSRTTTCFVVHPRANYVSRATALQAVANAVVARLKSQDADDNDAMDATHDDAVAGHPASDS